MRWCTWIAAGAHAEVRELDTATFTCRADFACRGLGLKEHPRKQTHPRCPRPACGRQLLVSTSTVIVSQGSTDGIYSKIILVSR